VFRGLSSLRARTLLVICTVVVVPVIFIWLTSPFEEAIGHSMRHSLRTCVDQASDFTRTMSPQERYLELAESCDIWIRVIDDSGKVEIDANGLSAPGLRERLLFAPDPVPTLPLHDEILGALTERKVVQNAREHGEHGSCTYQLEGRLFVCEYAKRVEFATHARARTVYAATASSRSLSILYSERDSVLRLTILVMVIAIALGLWLGMRLGKPLTRLRDQVRARTVPVVSTAPIEVEGDDEFAELGRAFNDLLLALDQKNQANEAFMADMAHEIKNPVAAIRAAAESLERRPEMDAARAERLAKILRDSSARLDTVVTRFLELARAESGLPKADRAEIRVDELVRNIVDSFAHDERYTALNFDVKTFACSVSGSPEHLETIIRNLVANAASFAASQVRVRVERREDRIFIEVQDDGKGIAAEDVPRVFDRFFTRRDDGGGTGLGLAMVLALTRAHGGQVDVSSQPGKGATFTVILPALTGLA
jgi:two-component system sensor histidine kinase ChvG